MKHDPQEKTVNWVSIVVFVALAILLSSLWAQYARSRGLLVNPQNAAVAAAIAQTGVFVSALVTMSLFARGNLRRIGWRVGPWTAYAAVALVLVALVALMSLPMALGFQRLAGGREIPSEPWLTAIPLVIGSAFFFAFAGEFGWRGFLLPGLLPLGARAALLWSGVLWFCWQVPLICLGLTDSTLIQNNFSLTLLCHFLGTVALSVIFGYLRLRFGSICLPTFAHGLLNTLAGLSLLFFTEANPFWNDFSGPVGTALTLAVAVVVWLRVSRELPQGIPPGPATKTL